MHYAAYIALSVVRLEFEGDTEGALAAVKLASTVDPSKPEAHATTASVRLMVFSFSGLFCDGPFRIRLWVIYFASPHLTQPPFPHGPVVPTSQVLASKGQHDEAITSFLLALNLLSSTAGKDLIASDPRLVELAASLRPKLAACFVAKGRAAQASAGGGVVSSGAEAFFESALSHDPGCVEAHAGLAEELFARAEAADDLSMADADATAASGKKGKKGASDAGDAAIRLYASALKHKPDLGAAYMRMGLALERQGLVAEALACQDKAVKCDATLVGAHKALGRLSTEPEDVVIALEQACLLVAGDYMLRVQYGTALLAVGRLAEALEAGRAAHAIEPKRFEALVVMGDAADGLEAYPTAASSFRRALATVVDSRAKFNIKAVVVHADGNTTTVDEASRKESRKKQALLATLHAAFKQFEQKGRSGTMDGADLVLLLDALGVPPSSPAVAPLRELVAAEQGKKRGSILGGGKADKKSEVRLRDVEAWWLKEGSAAVTSSAGAANATMADLDGSGGTGVLASHAPESLSDEAKAGLERADLGNLYLRLGVSYYRALLNRDDKAAAGVGSRGNNRGGDDDAATDAAGSGGGGIGSSALVAYTRPTKQGGPAFGSSRAAGLGASSSGGDGHDDDGLAAQYEVRRGSSCLAAVVSPSLSVSVQAYSPCFVAFSPANQSYQPTDG